MNCSRDGALLERVKTTTLRLLKSPLLPPFKITPLRSSRPTLMGSIVFCRIAPDRVLCRHGVSFLMGYVIASLFLIIYEISGLTA